MRLSSGPLGLLAMSAGAWLLSGAPNVALAQFTGAPVPKGVLQGAGPPKPTVEQKEPLGKDSERREPGRPSAETPAGPARETATAKVGATVYNLNNEPVGIIEKILQARGSRPACAVVSVGTFLGGGSKLVEIAVDQLNVDAAGKIVLSAATREWLTLLPNVEGNEQD